MLIDPSSWSWDDLQHAATSNAAELAAKAAKDAVGVAVDATKETIKRKWSKLHWNGAAEKYLQNLFVSLNKTKILGNPKLIEIDKIYTDVYLHSQSSASRHFSADVRELNHSFLHSTDARKRIPALDQVMTGSNLFVLGKPGAGKTTFLKYLAIQCCQGSIALTPVFVPLKDWADSDTTLIEFISRSFDVCGFPIAEPFVRALLKRGGALILLDGLDEVNEEQGKRDRVTKSIVEFSQTYRANQYCLTCRTAATDYSFAEFEYAEVADFSLEQQLAFVGQWYGAENERLLKFRTGWLDPNQENLRELGRTPLLLTLLCLAFDDTLTFPARQVDLYRDALDALLRKWDVSRLITRDSFYRKLSHSRRELLLEKIASHFFFESKVVFRRADVEVVVIEYLDSLPEREVSGSADAGLVLRQLEAQHGIIVERANGIYSFSHLSIQEYLTAAFLVKSKDPQLLIQMATQSAHSSNWREVLLYTVGMMGDADVILSALADELARMKAQDAGLVRFLAYAHCQVLIDFRSVEADVQAPHPFYAVHYRYDPHEFSDLLVSSLGKKVEQLASVKWINAIAAEIETIRVALDKKAETYDFGVAPILIAKCVEILTSRPELARRLLAGDLEQSDFMTRYLYATRLLVECLEVGLTRRRKEFLAQILCIDDVGLNILAQAVGASGT